VVVWVMGDSGGGVQVSDNCSISYPHGCNHLYQVQLMLAKKSKPSIQVIVCWALGVVSPGTRIFFPGSIQSIETINHIIPESLHINKFIPIQ
jgi:hypothetical protein